MTHSGPVLFQFYHWYTPNDGSLWKEIQENAENLARRGFTAVWFPPAYKGVGGVHDVGYGVYDLYDLGEFDQKGTVRTKYGTKDELIAAVQAVKDAGMQAYADIVLNHKDGADHEEEVVARAVDCDDRLRVVEDFHTIRAWTHFTFPGRGNQYSKMKWHWWHFVAVNHDSARQDNSNILLFEGKQFAHDVCGDYGNQDYLLGCDIDHTHEEVRKDLYHWGEWFMETTGFDGLRLDAVKHISCQFMRDWVSHLRNRYDDRFLFSVAEYWSANLDELRAYLNECAFNVSLFDVPLHYNFHRAGEQGREFDLSHIFSGTLVQDDPWHAVTFVENHDTQLYQSLQSPVADWFKPFAYALILLRESGYPCVFYADYYGAKYQEGDNVVEMPSFGPYIDRLLELRHKFGYGEQIDYFDHKNCVAWVRKGDEAHDGAMVVVMSNGDDGFKDVDTGRPNMTFCDALGNREEPVRTNEDGKAFFPCKGGSLSIWIPA